MVDNKKKALKDALIKGDLDSLKSSKGLVYVGVRFGDEYFVSNIGMISKEEFDKLVDQGKIHNYEGTHEQS